MSDSVLKLHGVWKGYLSGSNRGRVVIRLRQTRQGLEAQTLFLDYQFGPVIVPLRGTLQGREAKFRLMEFDGFAPLLPLDGQLSITFDENCDSASGNWSTDIGTGGICRLDRSNESSLRWLGRLARVRLRWFWVRWRAKAYFIGMLVVAAASLLQAVHLTSLVLVLLLLPAPFLFSNQLSRLIGIFHDSRIKKIGPVEFEQGPPTADVVALMQQHAQEAVAFYAANNFFVFRTKLLLIVLWQQGSLELQQFTALASHIGIQADNVKTTLDAMLQAQCVAVNDGKVSITAFGRAYIGRGVRLLVAP